MRYRNVLVACASVLATLILGAGCDSFVDIHPSGSGGATGSTTVATTSQGSTTSASTGTTASTTSSTTASSSSTGPSCMEGETKECFETTDGTPVSFPGGSPQGPCKSGTKTCTGGVFGPCEGLVAPGVDQCGGDQSCNGIPSEGYTCNPGSTPCGTCGSYNLTRTCNAQCSLGDCRASTGGEILIDASNPIITIANGCATRPAYDPNTHNAITFGDSCNDYTEGPNIMLPPGNYVATVSGFSGGNANSHITVQVGSQIVAANGATTYASFALMGNFSIAPGDCEPINVSYWHESGALTYLDYVHIQCTGGDCQ